MKRRGPRTKKKDTRKVSCVFCGKDHYVMDGTWIANGNNHVLCHDLLAPEGYGEIIGGGERTWSEEEILARIDEEGTPREPYQFYIDTRTYGGVPHGGFGLGVDRVCSWLSGAEHIREVIPFPRDSRRVTP